MVLGGGQVPNKVLILHERAKRASTSETHFQDSKYICIYTINVVSYNYVWYGAINDIILEKTLTLRKIYEYARERSERALTILTFSHSKTAIFFNILLVLQILCLTNIFLFRSQITSVYIYMINAVSFYHLWYDAIYKRQYTDKPLTLRKCSYMRASLENFLIFLILKLLFPSISFLVLQILCLRTIFNFRCQITSAYIYNQCSFLFLSYGMMLYINDSILTNY